MNEFVDVQELQKLIEANQTNINTNFSKTVEAMKRNESAEECINVH